MQSADMTYDETAPHFKLDFFKWLSKKLGENHQENRQRDEKSLFKGVVSKGQYFI